MSLHHRIVPLVPYRQWLLKLALAASLLLLNACASQTPIPAQPFNDYQQAINDLTQQSQQALHEVAQQDLAQFKAQLNAGEHQQQLTSLLMNFPSAGDFSWCYTGNGGDCASDQAPLFIHSARMEQGLASINQLLQDYAALLLRLANANNNGIDSFDPNAEAQRFQRSTQQSIAQLRELGLVKGQAHSGLSLFSTIAANLADNYLIKRQQDSLAQVLEAGREPLNQVIKLAQEAIKISAAAVKSAYQNQAPGLLRQTLSSSDKASSLDALLATNQKTQAQLALYEHIAQGYGALAGAQQQLIQASQAQSEVHLAQLILYARKIQLEYENLKQQSQASAAQ